MSLHTSVPLYTYVLPHFTGDAWTNERYFDTKAQLAGSVMHNSPR